MNARRIAARVIAPACAVVVATWALTLTVDAVPVVAWEEPPVQPVEIADTAHTVTVGEHAVDLARDDLALPVAPAEEPVVIGIDDGSAPVNPGYEPAPIFEDEPGWDCRTMGNRQCGVTVNGTDYILSFDTMTFIER